jgi:ribosomal protein S18 acetylase RimI-like enzyme
MAAPDRLSTWGETLRGKSRIRPSADIRTMARLGAGMREPTGFQIAPVRTAEDLAATVALFRAYAASLEVDLSYQDFEAEMAAMPGKYAPPAGELLLARDAEGKPVGCVGLRPLDLQGCCEMKRFYVSPQGRGIGLGKGLVEAVVEAAERVGYREMRLDTLPSMAGAQALYRKLGFEAIERYYDTPVVGTLFMRRFLARADAT